MKKLIKSSLALVLTVGLLTGCSGVDVKVNLGGSKTAKTAQEVIDNYNEKEFNNNAHIESDFDCSMTMSYDGESVSIPYGMYMKADATNNAVHSETRTQLDLFDTNIDSTEDRYILKDGSIYQVYVKSTENDYWTKSEVDGYSGLIVEGMKLYSKDFANATFEYNKDTEIYILRQDFSSFISTTFGGNSIGTANELAALVSQEEIDLTGKWEDIDVIYTFDKEYNFISLAVSSAKAKTSIEKDGEELSLAFELDFNIKYSNIGGIKEDDVTVPASIVDEAVPAIGYEGADTNVDTNSSSESNPVNESNSAKNESTEIESKSTENSEVSNSEVNISNRTEEYDLLGQYNGTGLTIEGDSWDETFGADGWEFDSEDQEYSFLVTTNSKYDDASLYVYSKSWTDNNSAKDELLNDGIYGYNIEISYDIIDNAPNMTWLGVTFGDSANNVYSAYGEPEYKSETDVFTTLNYNINDVDLSFTIDNKYGLVEVSVMKY